MERLQPQCARYLMYSEFIGTGDTRDSTKTRMNGKLSTVQLAGRLSITSATSALRPLVVHQDTPLRSIAPELAAHAYILATNNEGRIVGLVRSDHVRERLQAENIDELKKWEKMPLRALIRVAIYADISNAVSSVKTDMECTALAENGTLFAIALEEDVFVSWRCVEPILSGAIMDPLTGLMNRLSYERRLQEEWFRARRSGSSVAIIVIDVNKLKQINDRHGHQAGDIVLQNIANILETTLRSYDVVARYGGDEFVALCLGCRVGEIDIPIRRIQEAIASTSIEFEQQTIQIAASVGGAVRHDNFERSNPAELFSAADKCMYHAKRTSGTAFSIEYGEICKEIRTPIIEEHRISTIETLENDNPLLVDKF